MCVPLRHLGFILLVLLLNEHMSYAICHDAEYVIYDVKQYEKEHYTTVPSNISLHNIDPLG